MEEDSNWVKARSSIVWIAAVLVAFGAVWWIERQTGRELIERQNAPATAAAAAAPTGRPAITASADRAALPAPRALTDQERQWARLAWSYFERNTDARTGLAGSVEAFPSSTMWDTASYLLAVLAARDLQLIEEAAFDQRMAAALASLERLPLYANALPNKSYDVRTLAMTDYANKPSPGGIGWSAIDIGRLLVPLNVIAWHHPRHTEAARRVIARWNTTQLARDGQLYGMEVENGAARAVQEGRLGYEQYAARTFALMGLDVDVALDPTAYLQWVEVEGIQVPADRRDPKQFGAQNYVLSEPWMLMGLEFGFTRQSAELAWRVYRAQEERFRKSGVRTAVTEDHVDQAPFFLYNSVYSGGKPWATVTEKGEEHARLRTLSTKAAFAWHALYRTPYTTQLVEAVSVAQDPAKGWYAGLYEAGGQPNRSLTANTNAVVLESLAYIARGPALRYR
ncbi:MAG TPA: DUF3131 domain-containing protein [Ramlibacter sp.]|nr:DUF3131 domain-containing protein [Ramlibacter sp.]